MKVNQFLKNAKNLFANKSKIVIGNQSADLDSIVSSISMSFYMSNVHRTNFIPVINSTKSVLKSKKECLLLFDYFSIDLDNDIIFLSDFSKNQISEVILVDHNELEEEEKQLDFQNLITGIIDHHVDKQNFLNINQRIVDISVGSCASLITDLIAKSGIEIDESFALMLLFPILSDTSNLTIRASQKDIEMVEYLRKKLVNVSTDDLYKKIEQLKFSVDFQDINTLLKKDFKKYQIKGKNWGLSSVNFCLKEWISLCNDFGKIDEFISEKDLYFYGILSCFKTSSNEFKRDLALFGSEDILNRIKLNLSTDSNLILVTEAQDNKNNFLLYDIINVSLSRKYWQPVLENCLNEFIFI